MRDMLFRASVIGVCVTGAVLLGLDGRFLACGCFAVIAAGEAVWA